VDRDAKVDLINNWCVRGVNLIYYSTEFQ